MMSSAAILETGTILDQILARTVADVAGRKGAVTSTSLEHQAARMPEPIGLRRALAGPTVAVIAEIKRASPSRGVFPVAVDPPVVAGEYLDGGAAALSVLTDEPFFHGSLEDLSSAASVAHGHPNPAPVLRKDFIVDHYQIVEARASGADAFLLIVAALSDRALRDLLHTGVDYGMDAMVEVHDEDELERAVAVGATLIGINNRNLRTFEVDLAVSERLAPLVPAGTIVVGESGIFSSADVQRLQRAGVHAVLVGESLIVAPDRTAAVRLLLDSEAVRS